MIPAVRALLFVLAALTAFLLGDSNPYYREVAYFLGGVFLVWPSFEFFAAGRRRNETPPRE